MDMDIKISEFRFFCTISSVFCFLAFVSGCDSSYTESPLQERVEILTIEQQQLISQLEQSKAKNEQLTKQIHTLSGLPEELKGQNLYSVQNIEIGKYTGLFDKDKDGTKEKLIVYIEPHRRTG